MGLFTDFLQSTQDLVHFLRVHQQYATCFKISRHQKMDPPFPRCRRNVCLCQNGLPKEGDSCKVDAVTPGCKTCNDGYYMDGNVCGPRKCLCKNGRPAEGKECPKNGAQQCKKCNKWYHISRGRCVINQCVCPHGEELAGKFCDTDGVTEGCKSCDKGHHLDKKKCVPNECKCDNGTGVRGLKCMPNGASICVACNEGFKLIPKAGPKPAFCQPELCKCENGTPLTGIGCAGTAPGCQDCNTGFRLNKEKKCEPNICKCPNGEPATGEACADHGGRACEACDKFFHLARSNTQCKENYCPV